MDTRKLSPKANQILDIAENHMRQGGFDAISFRDIATAVGVKSASVHYHFPAKADLGEAMVARYRDSIMDDMGDPSEYGMSSAMQKLTAIYRTALTEKESVCLCTILGAASHTLPEAVAAEVKKFFDGLHEWTKHALNPKGVTEEPEKLASAMISILQGGTIMAVATGNSAHFQAAADLAQRHVQTEEFKQKLFNGHE